jgi:NAD(P)-dependent dehydrogenase (short-subunit alcohol dehydrogenase family)
LRNLADGAAIVMTTSGTHDPATGAGLVTPRHADALLLAHPDRDPHLEVRPKKAGEHAYTASKLCTILTAAALSAQPEILARRIAVMAYCPGQVFGTGLAKNLPFPMPIIWRFLGSSIAGWPLRRLNRFLNTAQDAGTALADLGLRHAKPTEERIYAALRGGRLTWPDPSQMAGRGDLALKLWKDSAELVDLPA